MTIGHQYETPYEQDQRNDEREEGFQDREPGFPSSSEESSTETTVFEPDGASGEHEPLGTGSGESDSQYGERPAAEPESEATPDAHPGLADAQPDFATDTYANTVDDTSAGSLDVSDVDVSDVDVSDVDVSDTADTAVVDSRPRTGEHAVNPQWTALQGAFVDDPDAAVRDAAALVDDAMNQLLASLQTEQSGESSTEQKRLAFQRYRAVHEVLTRV